MKRHCQAGDIVCAPGMWGISDDSLRATEYYNDYLRPQQLFQNVGVVLLKDKESIAGLSLMRKDGAAPFEQREKSLLRALTPHLQQALQIHQRLSLAQQDGLSVAPEGLRAAHPAQTSALRQLVAGATLTGTGHGTQAGGTLRVSRPSGKQPLELLVVPLRCETLLIGFASPGAVVFLSDPGGQTQPPEKVLSQLYGLTPAETRLCSLLLQGRSVEEAAEQLAVALSTVKTHLRGIFGKTETRNQAGLIRRLLSGPAQLRQR